MNSSLSASSGYLEIIVGPMFSGKTSRLIELHKQFTFCNIPVLTINHTFDTRYHESMLSNHNQDMIECSRLNALSELWDEEKGTKEYLSAQVILINECQFFPDLYCGVVEMLKDNKRIYIAGLDGDFKRQQFGQVLNLIPLCDTVTKLSALCNICKNGTIGIFSKRITQEIEQTVVGSDNYIPVCRKCYEKNE